jgi:hypothetical protein
VAGGTGDPRENEDGPVIRRARFGDLRSNPRTERRDRTTAPSISNRGHSPHLGSAVGRDREGLPELLCAPRGAIQPGGVKGPTCGLSQQAAEAGGSLILGALGWVGAASTKTGRVGTTRRPGSGKQDGEVYECRNQWWNPLKSGSGSNLVDLGR